MKILSKHFCAMSRRSLVSSVVLGLILLTVCGSPAQAQRGRNDHGHGRPAVVNRNWRDHEYRASRSWDGRRYRQGPGVIYAPPLVYAPPPYYAEPEYGGGPAFNFIIPLHIN